MYLVKSMLYIPKLGKLQAHIGTYMFFILINSHFVLTLFLKDLNQYQWMHVVCNFSFASIFFFTYA
jgi:hypothetical protein